MKPEDCKEPCGRDRRKDSEVGGVRNNSRLDAGQIEVVDNAMAEVLRRKTPAERIRIGFNIWISARDMLMIILKETHPDWSEEVLRQEVIRRLSHGAV